MRRYAGLLIVFGLLLFLVPWQLMPGLVAEVNPPVEESAEQVDTESRITERKKMVVENLGPCDCCGGGSPCSCQPSSCMDLDVEITGTDSALDGTYIAEWDAGKSGWVFTASDCEWVVSMVVGSIASDGEDYHSFQIGNCTESAGISNQTFNYTHSAEGALDHCELGSASLNEEGKVVVSWPCILPEYFTVNFGGGNCATCNGIEIPITCSESSVPFEGFWEYADTTQGPCWSIMFVSWNACDKILSFDWNGTIWEKQNVTAMDIATGGSFTLNHVPDNHVPGLPSTCNNHTIAIQGHNNGKWCL